MTLFSKLLKHYIESSGYTIYQLSKRSGLNRTSIQKAISEDRLPHLDSLKELEKLLNLTPDEHRLFWESYEQAFYGEALFRQRQSVRRLLASLSCSPLPATNPSSYFPDLHMPQMPENLPSGGKLYQGILSFAPLFRDILDQLCKKEDGSSHQVLASFASMPPSLLFHSLFSRLADETSDLSVSQIVYFIKNPGDSGRPSYNLDLLSLYLPFFFFCGSRYEASYVYRESLTAAFAPELFPSYMVFPDKAVLFSADFQTIWVETDSGMVSHFRRAFFQTKTASSPLAMRLGGIGDLLEQDETFSLPSETRLLFRADSLKKFAHTGILCEKAAPISPRARYRCLKKLEKACLDDSFTICALPSTGFPLSPGLSVILQGTKLLTIGFPDIKKESWYHISISENTIVDSFLDFIDMSLENEEFLSREEILGLVRELLSYMESSKWMLEKLPEPFWQP